MNAGSGATVRWGLVGVGFAIAYSPSYVNPILRWVGADWARRQGPPSVLLWNWLAVGVLFAFVLLVEKRRLSSIALTMPNWKDILWAVVFWVIATVASGFLNALVPLASTGGFQAILALPLPVIVAIILTTATTEEILFRGYPIERLRELTGSIWLGVAISFALFVVPHVRFFGPEWLVTNGVSVVLLYILYVWRRNLWATMTMHLLGNALLLLPATGMVN